MKSFFDHNKKYNESIDKMDLSLELTHLFTSSFSKKELQSLFNHYLEGKLSLQFILKLSQNLDKIHDGDLLYQAYKIIQNQHSSDCYPYLDVLLKASNLGSFHARHELVQIILLQNLIQVDKTWIIWSLEYLRTAIQEYYELPNDLFNLKNLFRDLLRINTYLQTVLGNNEFYIDKFPEQTSPEYELLTSRLLERTRTFNYFIILPKSKGYTYDIRLHALFTQHPIYIGDSYAQLIEESKYMTTSEEYNFKKLISRNDIPTLTIQEYQTISKP